MAELNHTMSKEKAAEVAKELPSELLRAVLLTTDGKGPSVKEAALDELISRKKKGVLTIRW